MKRYLSFLTQIALISCIMATAIILNGASYAKRNISINATPEEQLPGAGVTDEIPFEEFLNQPSYLFDLKKQAMKHERAYGSCSSPVYQGRVFTGLPQAPRHLPEQQESLQWIEVLKIGGCNTFHELHVLTALINGEPQFFPLLPGNGLSLLDLAISNDVMNTLISSEQQMAAEMGCSQTDAIRFHDIRLLSKSVENGLVYWNEAWEVSNCKIKKTLTINFTSSETTGTEYVIGQPEPVNAVAKRKQGAARISR